MIYSVSSGTLNPTIPYPAASELVNQRNLRTITPALLVSTCTCRGLPAWLLKVPDYSRPTCLLFMMSSRGDGRLLAGVRGHFHVRYGRRQRTCLRLSAAGLSVSARRIYWANPGRAVLTMRSINAPGGVCRGLLRVSRTCLPLSDLSFRIRRFVKVNFANTTTAIRVSLVTGSKSRVWFRGC